MNNVVARFLSYVLHPLLMPFYAIVLIMNLNTYISYSISTQVQRIIISLVFITTMALPVITAVLLLQKGMIRTLEMESASERRLPFITTAIYYLICFYLLWQLPVPRLLSMMLLAATATIFIAFFFTFRWKISIHMIGIGGLTGVLFGLSQILNINLVHLIIGSFIIAGLLGTARLILGAHTPQQVYTGFLIGFFSEWIVLTIFSA